MVSVDNPDIAWEMIMTEYDGVTQGKREAAKISPFYHNFGWFFKGGKGWGLVGVVKKKKYSGQIADLRTQGQAVPTTF